MLIYDDFVFLHMPKTAGLFVKAVLREEIGPPAMELGTHATWGDIPPEAAGLPALMFVRNPWDWYVSWYHYWTGWVLPNRRSNPANDNPWPSRLGTGDFATVLQRACSDDLGDYYTAVLEHMSGAAPRTGGLTLGRYERLVDDLERFLAEHESPVETDSLSRIRAREPVNAFPHRPYREYYDDELRELVGASCKELIEKFGYAF